MKRLLALLLALPGFAHAWEPVEAGKPISPGSGEFAVQFPEDWLYQKETAALVASYDGPLLESIRVRRVPFKSAFKAAKKTASATSAPEDLAEDYVADSQAAGMREVALIEVLPAELAGQPGFRVHFRCRLPESQGGALIEEVTVGAAMPFGLLLATFRAPAIHYYEKWLPAFEHALTGITALPSPANGRPHS